MREDFSDSIREFARRAGADLIGVASRNRFIDCPADSSPLSIFPEMNSVIVLARRVLRGALRGVEEGTNFSSTFGSFGYKYLEDNFLSQTTYDVTLFIEENGFEAVPIFAYFPDGMPKGTPISPESPAPNVIMDPYFVAHAAGLGEIGLGDFFITPEYGTRQRFAFIITDAVIEPDPIMAKGICGDCGECASACPFGAIDVANTHTVGVPGFTMQVATVDYSVCRNCPNGAMLLPGRGSRPDRIAAACGRQCLVKLESAKKTGNAFANPFRKREPWAMDMMHRPITAVPTDAPADVGCGKNLDTIGQKSE